MWQLKPSLTSMSSWNPAGPRRGNPLVRALLVAAVLLSGCVGPEPLPLPSGDEGCETVGADPPRAGSRFAYNASGHAFTRPLDNHAVLDWGAATGEPEREAPLRFGGNTSLAIETASEAGTRRAISGDERAGWQVTLTAHSSNRSARLPFHDVWLDAETGHPIQIVARNQQYHEELGTRHFLYPGGWDLLPLVLGGPFWNRTLEDGESGTLVFTDGIGFPEAEHDRLRLDWTATTAQEEARCVARLEARIGFHNPDEYEQTVNVTLAEDRPLPVRYQTDVRNPDFENLVLEMTGYEPGDGPQLPAYREAPHPEGKLDRGPTEDGFLPDRGGAFATSYDEALEALREGEETGPWLEEHPDARPQWVQHSPGAPDDRIVDGWEMRWVTPEGEADRLRATKKRPLLPLGNDTEVETSVVPTDGTYPYPAANRSVVTLAAMGNLHEEVYGAHLRALQCRFTADEVPTLGRCKFGPVNATSHGYHGEVFAGFTWGLRVWLEEGWLLYEHSWSEKPVPPPASAQ